jgi:hypothetical protein
MTDEEYEQEMLCSFDAALRGAIFAKYIHQADMDGRIAPLNYDPGFPVHIAGDIGRRDATAMWHWQDRPDGIAILDYDEHSGGGVDEFDQIFRGKPWGTNIGTLYLPHDAKAKTFATKRSAIEQFHDLGYKARLVPSLSKQDGITAARLMLKTTWFNAYSTAADISAADDAQKRVEEGLDALRSYRHAFNESHDTFSDTTVHDWASHGADGYRYLSLVARQAYKPRASEKKTELSLPGEANYNFTLDQLHASREDDLQRWNANRI